MATHFDRVFLPGPFHPFLHRHNSSLVLSARSSGAAAATCRAEHQLGMHAETRRINGQLLHKSKAERVEQPMEL